MQSIYLHDEVKIEKKRREGIEIVSNLRFLPIGEELPEAVRECAAYLEGYKLGLEKSKTKKAK